MSKLARNEWETRYAKGLRRYLEQEQESLLQQAYELGRRAIAQEFGILHVARVHHQAAANCLWRTDRAAARAQEVWAAQTFLLETLAPFEALHRGFRLANDQLQRLNQALEETNQRLAHTNRNLEKEVIERKRTEKALRASEEHYRGLLQQARFMQESLRNLSTQILHVQEEERKRVSRELHDEVGQALTAISTVLETSQRNHGRDASPGGSKIAEAQNLLAQTMDTVHRFARELRPPMLDELGLLPALRSYLKSLSERTGLEVRFTSAVGAEEFSAEQKTVVFRVAQESLNNVIKHAQAGRVAVSLHRFKTGLRLRIRDNGRGFPSKEQLLPNGKQRLGLLGMQERVRLVNGRFAINSAPGKGTTISVEVPFEPVTVSLPRHQPGSPQGLIRGQASYDT